MYERHKQNLQTKSLTPPIESSPPGALQQNFGRTYRVYTDIPHVEEFLTRPEFIISM